MDYKPNNLFHGMVVDSRIVKLSKFIDSPPAIAELERSTPEEVLTNLVRSAGIISKKSGTLSLAELVKTINFKKAFRKNYFQYQDIS